MPISRNVVSNIHGPRYAALAHRVGPHHGHREAVPRDLVRARDEHRVHHRGARRIRADVGDVLEHRDRLDHVVGVEPNAHLAALVARVSRPDQVLAPVLHPLHGLAEQPRGEHHRALLAEHEHLLPEPTADIARRHGDAGLVDLEETREEVAGLVHRLRRAHDAQLAAPGRPRRDDPAGLHREREVTILLDRALHDVRRVRERLVEITR